MPILKVANVHFDEAGSIIQRANGSDLTLSTNTIERIRLDSFGNVLIGKTSSTVGNGVKIDVNGGISCNSLILPGSTSGTVNLVSPAVAGTTTLNLPGGGSTINFASVSGTINPTGPVFQAYASGTTSIPSLSSRKLSINTIRIDTNNNFDTLLSRFTPTVSGYYILTGTVRFNPSYGQETNFTIYKNGSPERPGFFWTSGGTNSKLIASVVTGIVYLNGTTDYVELYVYCSSAATTGTGANIVDATNFGGALLRV